MAQLEREIPAADLQPGDLFKFPHSDKVYRCYKASRLFKGFGQHRRPSDQMYLATGNSGADCIATYFPADLVVALIARA